MKILFVSSEAHPFAKSGGLGDVAYSLPKALVKTTDIRVIMPKYTNIHDRYRSGMKLVSKFTTSVSWREKCLNIQISTIDIAAE